jgi:hypothetical protein
MRHYYPTSPNRKIHCNIEHFNFCNEPLCVLYVNSLFILSLLYFQKFLNFSAPAELEQKAQSYLSYYPYRMAVLAVNREDHSSPVWKEG